MITFDEKDARPAYEQIREQLTDHILSGTLTPGHRLPSVRQLAGDLAIAAGTVARAYSELESDGLITASKSGTRVREVEKIAHEIREAARDYVSAVSRFSGSLEEAMRAIRVEWAADRRTNPTRGHN